MKARDVMTPRVISIETDAPIMRAVQLMLQNRISGLPVVGPKGELVGMVTEGDFLRRGEIGTQRRRNRWLEAARLQRPGSKASKARPQVQFRKSKKKGRPTSQSGSRLPVALRRARSAQFSNGAPRR